MCIRDRLPIGVLRTDGKENLMTSIEIAVAQNKEGRALAVSYTHLHFKSSGIRLIRIIIIGSTYFTFFSIILLRRGKLVIDKLQIIV